MDELPATVRDRHPAHIVATLTAFAAITEEQFQVWTGGWTEVGISTEHNRLIWIG
jgi:hypothetical protein